MRTDPEANLSTVRIGALCAGVVALALVVANYAWRGQPMPMVKIGLAVVSLIYLAWRFGQMISRKGD